MDIGTTIKKHRRNRDMTQEQLAEYLRVSVSAVSQWESGKTAPDLSLIPAICNLFGISADELLGINQEQKEKRVEEIIENAKQYFRHDLKTATEILEAGIAEYPNHSSLMLYLMCVYFWQNRGNEETLHFLDKSIRLAHRILQESTDDHIREQAKQTLCYAYDCKGETEKALEIAERLPSIGITKELFLAYLTKGTEGYRAQQHFITQLLHLLESRMDNNRKLDDGTYAYTIDEMIRIRHKRLALYELLVEDGNYCFLHDNLTEIHIGLFLLYAEKQDAGNTLHHLSAAADHAIAYMQNEGDFTCLLLRGYSGETTFFTAGQDNKALHVRRYMNWSTFDFVRSTPEFTAILDRLAPVAGG